MTDQKEQELIGRIAVLEKKVELLRRGGCTCKEPKWYFANLLSAYRCLACGAVMSACLIRDDEVKPSD